MTRPLTALLLTLFSGPVLASLTASNQLPAEFTHVDFAQHIGQQLPLDAAFRDEEGRPVRLGDYFGRGRPVITVFTYFGCHSLCPVVLAGLTRSLSQLSLISGRDFAVVAISIEPKDKPPMARELRAGYLRRYRKSTAGWHFLTGEAPAIDAVTRQAGFTYKWDPKTRQYVHAAGILIAAPDGTISRYLFGVNYDPTDARLALVEASRGKLGNVVDQVLLFCSQYNPKTGTYGLVVMNTLRVAGLFTVVALAGGIFLMQRRRG